MMMTTTMMIVMNQHNYSFDCDRRISYVMKIVFSYSVTLLQIDGAYPGYI